MKLYSLASYCILFLFIALQCPGLADKQNNGVAASGEHISLLLQCAMAAANPQPITDRIRHGASTGCPRAVRRRPANGSLYKPVARINSTGAIKVKLIPLVAKSDDLVNDLIKSGDDAVKAGNRDAAIESYERVISLIEKMPNNHKALAGALVRCANTGLCEYDKSNWGKYTAMCKRAQFIIDADQQKWWEDAFLKKCHPKVLKHLKAGLLQLSIADCEHEAQEYLRKTNPNEYARLNKLPTKHRISEQLLNCEPKTFGCHTGYNLYQLSSLRYAYGWLGVVTSVPLYWPCGHSIQNPFCNFDSTSNRVDPNYKCIIAWPKVSGYPWDRSTFEIRALAVINIEKVGVWQSTRRPSYSIQLQSDNFNNSPLAATIYHLQNRDGSYTDINEQIGSTIGAEALSITTEYCRRSGSITSFTEEGASLCVKAMLTANNPIHTISAFKHLIMTRIQLGKYSDAERSCMDAVNYVKNTYGQNDLHVADLLELEGMLQKWLGNDKGAVASWTTSLSIRDTHTDVKQTYRFLNGAPNCEHSFRNGNVYERISTRTTTVEIMFVPCADCFRCDIHIINNSPTPVDVLPESIRLFVSKQPGVKAKPYQAKHISVARFNDKALALNTVAPGSDIAGIVCFEHSNLIHVTQLQVLAGKTLFSFR